MIHNELVTYEVAQLAKEKGFNEGCLHYYQNGIVDTDGYYNHYNMCVKNICSAPTQSLLQRWLREEKKVHIEIYPVFPSPDQVKYGRWVVADAITKSIPIEYFDTYEQALEDALAYGLINLD